MTPALQYFFRQLFDPEEVESAGQRLQFLLLEILVAVRSQYELWTWAEIIPNQPAITVPAGVGNYLDVSFMLRDPLYPQLNALLCGLFMLLGLTRRLRAGYALAFLSLSVQFAARYGLGKVQHGATMLGMAVLALGVAHLAFKREDLRRKAALGLLVTMISVGYIYAGTNKLRARGLRWVLGHNLWLWIRQKQIDTLSAAGRGKLNFLQSLTLKSSVFATLQLCFGLLSELSAVIMWWRPARRWVMLCLAGMHIGISRVMNIHFTPSVLILLCLALPIAELVDWLRARRTPAAPPPNTPPERALPLDSASAEGSVQYGHSRLGEP
jgi:hypothetical protein